MRKRPKYLSRSAAGSRDHTITQPATPLENPTAGIHSTLSDNGTLERSLHSFENSILIDDPGQYATTSRAAPPNTGTTPSSFPEVSRQTVLPAPEYVATTESHVGRSDYLGDSDVRFREEMVHVESDRSGISATDFELFQVQKAFELPSRSVQASLVDAYWKYCSPWTPILEPVFVEQLQSDGTSPLLLNALFLAGSRVSSSKTLSTLAEDFYRKARLLFMLGHEKDTLSSIIAVILLQWYNPTGPEHISTSTSGFWVRIAAGMAYQVGLHKEPVAQKDSSLRRRLWWSIVVEYSTIPKCDHMLIWLQCRDDIISVGTGRPRTIHFADSDVSPPTIRDFVVQDARARLFVAFSGIIRLLADLTEHIRRKTLTRVARSNLENALYRWIKELSTELRVFHGEPKKLDTYNFEVRQLQIPYFVTICILARHAAWRHRSVSASFIASSFVVGIFEDFLNRGELCHCGPVFTFYAFAAGLAQIPALQYRSLASTAVESLSTIQSCLSELKDRWGSAVGARAALVEMKRLTQRHPTIGDAPEQQSQDFVSFFEDFGPDLCKQYFLLDQNLNHSGAPPNHPADLSLVDIRQPQPEHNVGSSIGILEVDQGSNPQSMNADDVDTMFLGPSSLFFSDLDPSGTWMEDLGLGYPSY
ncbi:hypothetical protein LTS07_006355 [Exophiala sideris]|uniref:Xylanolytic transcriptional activator regulatory domain-containing protein n=1 Tax=Exophiala sideris TaxID=1016849 RepID=A0ABR0J679_9EURO|nr:hypothetical protein LTS07_006355 [Exophiala sideris]KAK5036093.1 hypothetical protein LTR13_005663 [Exophiala sideris]KAK5057130.1 hypothetical protein LTR69_007768 [Exophiala sideris]KAK5181537.1 hypothetical protein LTR44_006332 [Eurotiomycetes sp. CCFEE 6388]